MKKLLKNAMKRVINRTLYDTETAEQIANYNPTQDDPHRVHEETLYKSPGGDYFLHVVRGEPDAHSEQYVQQDFTEETLNLLDEEEAVDWCEDRAIDGAIVADEFGHLIETP